MTKQSTSEMLLRLIQRLPSIAFVWRNEPAWPVRFVSDNVMHLLGHSAEDFMEGRIDYADLIHPVDRERVGAELARNTAPDGPELWEHEPYRLKKRDGSWVWVQDITRAVRNKDGQILELEGVLSDVSRIISLTHQLQATLEEKRRQNEEYVTIISRLSEVETVVSSSSDMLLLIGSDGNLRYANTAFLKAFALLHGIDRSESLHSYPQTKALASAIEDSILAALSGESGVWEGWLELPRKGQQFLSIETRPFVSDHGLVDGVVIVARNQTTRHEHTVALQRLAKAVEHVSESIVVTDAEGIIEYVNPFFESTTGYSADEAIGSSPRILKSGTVPPAFYQNMWETLLSGRTWKGRFVNRRKSGELFTEDATISPIMSDTGEVTNYVAVKRDVSSEVSIMQQLRLTEQFETQNQVFRTMLHELNNRLAVITGHAELLSVWSAERKTRPESIAAILDATADVADLVSTGMRQLNVSTDQEAGCSLPDAVRKSCAMIERILPETVTFQTDIADESLPITMVATEVDQLVTNLVLNAAESIEDQGVVHVQVGPAAWVPEHLHSEGSASAYAKLVVSDTGSGMGPPALDTLFNQFHATNTNNAGSSLGLWTVNHLVEDHGGDVDVDSSPGNGTRMTIWLPLKGDGHVFESSPHMANSIKDRRILVVDDDQALLEMTAAMLTINGMHVTSHTDARQALSWLQSTPEPPDVVLTDVIMPDLDGTALASLIGESHPDLPVIFMSGYSEEIQGQPAQNRKYRHFLQKPFEADALLDLITTALPLTNSLAS